ncbi:amino acid ABC transporter permease [Thauera sinica]|uniref:Amino acid ABC transporter permease n=1 Tax=Thauera sinica TaxID=2665146 RepID=A0ABW1AKT5_9RHOO|nr:ABC transporter permease subunit [Thauera sp. K11]ATE62539.1 polar amino acid ABC transporter permease [Thauera sp. K11]
MNGIEILWRERDIFLAGLATTLSLCIAAVLLSLALSALGAVAIREASPRARAAIVRFVDLVRCVPFLLLAYVVYFGLPELGWNIGPYWAGLLTLTIYTSAYFVEIFRSAMMNLSSGCTEAARAYGFSMPALYRRIIFPQVAITTAPLVGNQIIMVLKDSAMLMIITVKEISFAANYVSTNYFSPFAPFVLAAGLYWSVSLLVEQGVRFLSKIRSQRYG